jgi:glycolate oxidase FAD binding subunit
MDAIVAVAPRRVFEPRSTDECLDIFRAACARKLALAVVGGRTELGLGAPPARLDALVCTGRLGRIVEYAPSDQVVIAEAGMTLSTLQATLAEHGQRLACDPPLADRATLGGLLATNGFGPLRTRFGSLRDLIIGVSIVRADGTIARGGGKVVKNVAGFDLPKLVVGSLGTLGMIATAAFRLHPLPESTTTLRIGAVAAGAVRALVVDMREQQLEPAAVVATGTANAFDVLVRFEGFASGVGAQIDRLLARLQGVDVLSSAEADQAWKEQASLRTQGNARIKISIPPAVIEAAASEVVAPLIDVLSAGRAMFYPTLGLGFVTGDVEDPGAFANAIARGRACMARHDGSLVVQELPYSLRGSVDVWGPPPAAIVLMKRVKDRFDPDRRLNAGRFVGGL